MTTYYNYSLEELKAKAKIDLAFYENEHLVFEQLADKMIEVIVSNNQNHQPTVIICPVGPVGHYPYFVEKINENKKADKHYPCLCPCPWPLCLRRRWGERGKNGNNSFCRRIHDGNSHRARQ